MNLIEVKPALNILRFIFNNKMEIEHTDNKGLLGKISKNWFYG